jgi:hypothetical protein
MVYHHNLHLWYKVVYICGIGVLLEVFSQSHKQNIQFLHFKLFSYPFGGMVNFFFKIQKQKCSFQI